uniref:Uncharacterized protein n=1 Tax=Tetranychus urticae TaxID=32264 RepID=T1K1Z3_TETUR
MKVKKRVYYPAFHRPCKKLSLYRAPQESPNQTCKLV